jgi:hypothetical protein
MIIIKLINTKLLANSIIFVDEIKYFNKKRRKING